MEFRHLSARWMWTGYGASVASFVVSALFFLDVFGEYFVSTSYLFPIDIVYELTIALVTAAVGVIFAALTYRRR